MEELYSYQTFMYYVISILVFLVCNIDDIHIDLKKRTFCKNYYKFIQNLLFTIVATTVGICICAYTNAVIALYWLVSIIAGFLGSSLLGKIDKRKHELSDTIIDNIENKISDKINNTSNKLNENNEEIDIENTDQPNNYTDSDINTENK